jgi:predicted TIM-barrel fold metal-dependent hydrolase
LARKEDDAGVLGGELLVTMSGVQDDGTLMDTLRSVGEDRVMFSADYPYEDDLEMAAWFDRLELNGRTKRKIGFENARVLLKLTG